MYNCHALMGLYLPWQPVSVFIFSCIIVLFVYLTNKFSFFSFSFSFLVCIRIFIVQYTCTILQDSGWRSEDADGWWHPK